MTINVGKFLSTIHQENINSCDEKNLFIYARTLQQLKLGSVFTVNNFEDLPSAIPHNGKLYYIKNSETLVWSNGSSWNRFNTDQKSLWSWGHNTCFILGTGSTGIDRICSPVREFCSANDWCQVSASNTVVAIKTSGQIWGWGINDNSGTGNGNVAVAPSPVREFCSASNWCKVATFCNSTAAIKTNGEMWVWGKNCEGELGIGLSATLGRCSPTREFCCASNWCCVVADQNMKAAIKNNGELWTWGRNSLGQLGIGSDVTLGRCSPVREFCSATDWCTVSVGNTKTFAIKTNGQLWAWGSNLRGSLGIGSSVTLGRCSPVREFCSATDWCQVSGGNEENAAAIKTSGQLWTWGRNFSGSLGIGISALTEICSPVREFCSATNWCQVSVGAGRMAAVKTNGELWVWGGDLCGALGTGNTISRCSPVREFCSSTDWLCVVAGSWNLNFTTALKIEKYI